jgi:hypothetical protein
MALDVTVCRIDVRPSTWSTADLQARKLRGAIENGPARFTDRAAQGTGGVFVVRVGLVILMSLSIWAFIDAIILFTGSAKDGEGRKLR